MNERDWMTHPVNERDWTTLGRGAAGIGNVPLILGIWRGSSIFTRSFVYSLDLRRCDCGMRVAVYMVGRTFVVYQYTMKCGGVYGRSDIGGESRGAFEKRVVE